MALTASLMSLGSFMGAAALRGGRYDDFNVSIMIICGMVTAALAGYLLARYDRLK